jgi:DNA-binding FadR family transcriptional regulator
MTATALSAALGVLVIIASAAFFVFGRRVGRAAERESQSLAKATAEQTAQRIVGEAERESESLRKSALISGKEELIKLRENWEVEARRRREEVEREEKRVQDRETTLDRKFDILEQRDKEIGRRASELGRKEKTVLERDAELDRMLADDIPASRQSDRLAETTGAFHRRMVELSGNATLMMIAGMLHEITVRHTAFVFKEGRPVSKADYDKLMRSYARLMRLLRAADGPAAEAHWRKHLDVARELSLQGLEDVKVRDVVG